MFFKVQVTAQQYMHGKVTVYYNKHFINNQEVIIRVSFCKLLCVWEQALWGLINFICYSGL